MARLTLALLALAASAAALSNVDRRHDGHDDASSTVAPAAASTASHSPDHTHAPSGTGHGHGMNHGAFNFTPSGIPWPQCLRDCCNSFFEYFPEPVNNPLCVSTAFYSNATKCIVVKCTEFEQGAFAVVAAVECPKTKTWAVDTDETKVTADMVKLGGKPQDCEGVRNETIICQNATSTKPPGPVTTGGAVRLMDKTGLNWVVTALVVGGPLAYFL